MADKKPTHVAVNSVQYHHEGSPVEVAPGSEFVGADLGDAKELKRLEGMGAIKKIKDAQKESEESETDKGAGTGGGAGAGSTGGGAGTSRSTTP